jgi:hypothetical protein
MRGAHRFFQGLQRGLWRSVCRLQSMACRWNGYLPFYSVRARGRALVGSVFEAVTGTRARAGDEGRQRELAWPGCTSRAMPRTSRVESIPVSGRVVALTLFCGRAEGNVNAPPTMSVRDTAEHRRPAEGGERRLGGGPRAVHHADGAGAVLPHRGVGYRRHGAAAQCHGGGAHAVQCHAAGTRSFYMCAPLVFVFLHLDLLIHLKLLSDKLYRYNELLETSGMDEAAVRDYRLRLAGFPFSNWLGSDPRTGRMAYALQGAIVWLTLGAAAAGRVAGHATGLSRLSVGSGDLVAPRARSSSTPDLLLYFWEAFQRGRYRPPDAVRSGMKGHGRRIPARVSFYAFRRK